MRTTLLKLLTGIALLFCLASLSSCKKSTEKTLIIRINQFQKVSLGWAGPVLQLATQQGSDIGTDNWTASIGNYIEGFNYEPGYIYDLVINQYDIQNPPQDSGSIGYSLNRVISKTKAIPNSTFKIDIKYKHSERNIVIGNSTAGYKLLGQATIDCGNLCNELQQVITGPAANITGKFSLNTDGSIKLLEILK